MIEKLYEILKTKPETRFSLQFIDYKNNEWTLPVLLLDYRIESFINDASLKSVKLLFKDGTTEIILNK